MTDEEYYRELVKLTVNTNVKFVVVDPSAASFIECIRRHGKFTVIRGEFNLLSNAYKALETGKIKICKNCSNILSEIFTYSNDTPIGKDDHAISDMAYFVNAMEREIV